MLLCGVAGLVFSKSGIGTYRAFKKARDKFSQGEAPVESQFYYQEIAQYCFRWGIEAAAREQGIDLSEDIEYDQLLKTFFEEPERFKNYSLSSKLILLNSCNEHLDQATWTEILEVYGVPEIGDLGTDHPFVQELIETSY